MGLVLWYWAQKSGVWDAFSRWSGLEAAGWALGCMDRCAPARHADVRRCRQVMTVVVVPCQRITLEIRMKMQGICTSNEFTVHSTREEWSEQSHYRARSRYTTYGTVSCVYQPWSIYIIALSTLMNSRHLYGRG